MTVVVRGRPDATPEQIHDMHIMLAAATEKELEELQTEQVAESASDNKEGGTGTRAKGEEGSMGSPNARPSQSR